MRLERVPVSSDKPTYVCSVGWRHSGVLLRNTGAADVFVGRRDELEAGGVQAGLLIAAGETVTVPAGEVSWEIHALTAAGRSELSYWLPG